MAKKIDYELKSKILSSPEFQEFKKYLSLANKYRLQTINGEVFNDKIISYEEFLFMENYFELLAKEDLKLVEEYYKIYHAHLNRTLRLKERITKILTSGDCLFLTLTFTDISLDKTSPKFRRIAVSRYLKQFNAPYVGNIDFGKRNGREHYHAVIGIGNVDYSLWKYGAINGIKIRNQTDDIKRISKYIAKLTNHAIKETTKRSVIIYSR